MRREEGEAGGGQIYSVLCSYDCLMATRSVPFWALGIREGTTHTNPYWGGAYILGGAKNNRQAK